MLTATLLSNSNWVRLGKLYLYTSFSYYELRFLFKNSPLVSGLKAAAFLRLPRVKILKIEELMTYTAATKLGSSMCRVR
jgi:hypothetical protein